MAALVVVVLLLVIVEDGEVVPEEVVRVEVLEPVDTGPGADEMGENVL